MQRLRLAILFAICAALGHESCCAEDPVLRNAAALRVVTRSTPDRGLAPETISRNIGAPVRSSLRLADLENWALRNNPTIAAADSLVRQAQGIWTQSGLYPNPTAGYLRTDPNQPRQSETQGIFLSQEFVTAKKLRLAQAADRQDIDWRRWQLEAQKGRVINDVRIRFYEVLGAQRAIIEATELERLAAEGVRTIEQLLQAQQASRPDVLQAEIQLHTIRIALQDAKYKHLTAWRQLANVAGVPNLPPTTLVGDLERLPQLDWQTSLDRLLAANPVLRSQRNLIAAARIDIRLARAQAVPNLNVQAVVQHDQVMKYNSVSTLAALPLPIFNRNQGNIQLAIGQLQQQQKEYERVQLALRDQLAGAFNQYLSARNQAEQLQKEILPRAKENLDLTVRAHKLGQFDFMRVRSARQMYFETSLAYIEALTALHKVAIEIEGLELTGGLNPTEIGTALQHQGGAGAGPRNVLLQGLRQQGIQGSGLLPGAIQGEAR